MYLEGLSGARPVAARPKTLLSLVLGFAAGIVLPIGGNLFLAELAFPLAAIWAAFACPRVRQPLRGLSLFIAVFACATAVMIGHDVLGGLLSDSKVWVRFSIFPILVLSVSALFVRDKISLPYFALANVAGILVAVALKQDYISATDIWRYNLGPWVAWCALLGFEKRGRPSTRFIAITLIALLLLVAGLRSLALVVFLTLLLWGTIVTTRKLRPGGRASLALTVVGLLIVVALPVFNVAATNGLFGETVREKQLWQTSTASGFWATARPHTRFEIEAIQGAPILGSGSRPQNSVVAGDFLLASIAAGRDYSLRQLDRTDIQTHSLIFDAWIRAGFLGGLAWFIATIAILRVIASAIWRAEFPGFATSYLMFLGLWNIFFSPMSPQARLFTAITIVVAFGVQPVVVRSINSPGSRLSGRAAHLA